MRAPALFPEGTTPGQVRYRAPLHDNYRLKAVNARGAEAETSPRGARGEGRRETERERSGPLYSRPDPVRHCGAGATAAPRAPA